MLFFKILLSEEWFAREFRVSFSFLFPFFKEQMLHFKLFRYYFIHLAYKGHNAEIKDRKETVRKCLRMWIDLNLCQISLSIGKAVRG